MADRRPDLFDVDFLRLQYPPGFLDPQRMDIVDRPTDIKRTCGPDNLVRFNQNIRPAC